VTPSSTITWHDRRRHDRSFHCSRQCHLNADEWLHPITLPGSVAHTAFHTPGNPNFTGRTSCARAMELNGSIHQRSGH